MEPFLGEIRLFGFGFVPKGWLPCNGQLLNISTNTALFSLLGTAYGGDGIRTFALPDYRGRVPVHQSSSLPIGATGGEEAHTLTVTEMPAHNHHVSASNGDGTAKSPEGMTWAVPQSKANSFSTTLDKTMSSAAFSAAGGSQPHSNMQPYLAINYCIAAQGIYPPRN
ncbi:tail Collar domain-containing protein [Paenibacillus sp. CCS19]|uniref:phage tail protein n=1 Tax=Paenibacillus sp. CCS19 TaxID=3158387 RepID=UPI00256093A2|nr:tail fiber protein [Paenibacillus cellulosilyticus]GMK42804.1 tail Collar domain-containing protein [Paenibacillus cellulosilyticus]